MLKSFLAAVLLSASVERFFVSRMRDFFKERPEEPQHILTNNSVTSYVGPNLQVRPQLLPIVKKLITLTVKTLVFAMTKKLILEFSRNQEIPEKFWKIYDQVKRDLFQNFYLFLIVFFFPANLNGIFFLFFLFLFLGFCSNKSWENKHNKHVLGGISVRKKKHSEQRMKVHMVKYYSISNTFKCDWWQK